MKAKAAFAEAKGPPTKDVHILADHQTYDEASGKSYFTGNVKVNYQDYQITAPVACLEVSKEGKPDVAIFYKRPLVKRFDTVKAKEDQVEADTVQVLLANKEMVAEGNSVSHVTTMASNPVTIHADVQQFDNANKTVLATGSVMVDYDKGKAYSPMAVMWMDAAGKAERVLFTNGAKLVKDDDVVTSQKVTIMVASGNMAAEGDVKSRLNMKGDRVAIDSDFQQYDKASSTMLASGNVKIVYGNYLTFGPKANFKLKNNQVETIYLLGRSSIITEGKKVFADKIIITTQPRHFDAFGNVQTQFISKDNQEPSGNAKSATPAAHKKPETTPGLQSGGKGAAEEHTPVKTMPVPAQEE